MTGRPTNGQTMNQQTDTALNLMGFFLKVLGDPKSIPVSLFGQVKCFFGTVVHFLGHLIYPEDLTDRPTNRKTINTQMNTASDLMCFLSKVSGVPKNIPVSFFWTSEMFIWDGGTFFGTPHLSGGFD